MELKNIIENIQLKNIINPQELDVVSLHYNSKECVPNSLFVAIQGSSIDGNKYIQDAIDSGARVIVCTDAVVNYIDGITYIIVANPRLSLAQISHLFYGNPANELICIGITGTNGKTTTAALVHSILKFAGRSAGFIGTTGIFYDDITIEATHTTPESLELAKILRQMADSGVRYAVIEVSSHSIVQHRIAGIHFSAIAFTNLTHEHLDFHKTVDEYANAKKLLFDGLDASGIAVINIDAEWGEYMKKDCRGSVKLVGERNLVVDYRISDVKIGSTASSFSLNDDAITLQLPAYFNIQNAAMSFAICSELGIEKSSIIAGLSASKGAVGRLQVIALRNGAVAYVDYAHTPDALEKSLTACKELVKGGVLICVFGCGGDRDRAKRPMMGALAESIADVVIITDDNPRTESSAAIINDILSGTKNPYTITVIANRSEAIQYAVSISALNDIILVAGKGHENYQIIGKEKHHFSDVEELQK